jgi:zinc transport system ATP-binding protein
MPAIELERVSLTRGGISVLEDVSLRVERGDVLSILGPNGGGKTTLLQVILGLLQPDAGAVRVLGEEPKHSRGRVGYVPQRAGFDLDFPIRVIDVALMGRLHHRVLGRRSEADVAAAHSALERVSMAELAERQIGALSSGQIQRVLIARALAQEPEILLLDEPTASLDERVGRSVWELFEPLSRELTIVVVSHDIGAISRYVKRVACLNRTLHAHESGALTPDMLELVYGCPIELVAHGHPHRVLAEHDGESGS